MKIFIVIILLVIMIIASSVAFDLHPTYLSRHLKNMLGKKIHHHKRPAFKNQSIFYINFIKNTKT